jgi:hypothetical protein
MAFITLICPHCGGDFELDPDRNLQPYWICPYCGNRSLMQKSDNSIRLRGIISGKTSLTSYSPQAQTRPAAEEPAASAPVVVPLPLQTENPPRSLADIIAEAVAEPTAGPAQPPVSPPSAAAAPDASPPPAAESEAPVRIPGFRPAGSAQDKSSQATEPAFDRLCRLAETAAKTRDLPMFNSYSRQAIDLRPADPRMYAWRAILTEEAGGFAQATWATPFWQQQTPDRKQFLIVQHFYNFSTALQFSQPAHRQDLITQIARLIVRQAVDHFNEQAQLRCAQNLIFKKFKGRFKHSDLSGSVLFTDALRQIKSKFFPVGQPELIATIRIETRLLPPRIARHLRKI